MNIAFDHVVVHEAIDDIGGLALRGADHSMMPQEMALIDEGILIIP
jgi:hypothetical protein